MSDSHTQTRWRTHGNPPPLPCLEAAANHNPPEVTPGNRAKPGESEPPAGFPYMWEQRGSERLAAAPTGTHPGGRDDWGSCLTQNTATTPPEEVNHWGNRRSVCAGGERKLNKTKSRRWV